MTTTGTTWDNLKLSFAGATEMPRNIIAHELLEIFFLPTNCTNGHEGNAIREWRPGRSHELSLMQGGLYLHVLWRSAFQARRPRRAYPRTSSPVTIATLCTAFQADHPQRNRFAHELHGLARIVAMG